MKDNYFINNAFEEAIKLYIASKHDKEGVLYNSFLVVVIRILSLIYGETDIINPYQLNNSVALLNNLSKYGMSKSDVALFKEELLSYYEFMCKNENTEPKPKNPYFRSVLKYLTDMFILKKQAGYANYSEEEDFLDLAYTSHTKNTFRMSYNYLTNDDPSYIEKYYYSKINSLDVTRDLSKTINMNLNLEALKYVGVNLSNIKKFSSQELAQKVSDTYKYFQVDATSPTREEELKNKIEALKSNAKPKLTTGNGYVDILLLMSVIVTSLSVVAIIVLTVI